MSGAGYYDNVNVILMDFSNFQMQGKMAQFVFRDVQAEEL